jgi:membrane protein
LEPQAFPGRALISNTYYRRAHDWVWAREPSSRYGRWLLHAARYALALVRDLFEGEISLRAMSLVYTTLLSLVPMLALAFSVLKALGVHDALQPVLERWLAPLGEQGTTLAHDVIGFVDNLRVGLLGSLGLVMLLYTSVSMISKVESSFNFIWKIGRTRGMSQRFSEYLVVLLVGPMLVFAALGMTASARNSALVAQAMSIAPFGELILALSKAVPYLLIIATFSFLYSFIPNTSVRLRAALLGGLFAGVAWESASAAFASFAANANYKAIYSGFAIVIVLLLWIYLGWLIILFGCRLAFYVQNPQFLAESREAPPPGSRESEYLALRVMAAVGGRFLRGEPPLDYEELRRQLAAPPDRLGSVVATLLRSQVLAESQPGRKLLPARDPGSYSLGQLWLWARGDTPAAPDRDGEGRRLLELLAGLEARAGADAQQSLRDWLEAGGSR